MKFMPIVQIATNIGKRLGSPFLKNVTRMVAEMTNKPEKAVVVMHNFNYEMWYDDSEAPLAHIRFTSLGMSISDHAHYSAKFAELINRDLGVATERVVVYFSSPEPTHIGKNGSTIAEIRKNQDN